MLIGPLGVFTDFNYWCKVSCKPDVPLLVCPPDLVRFKVAVQAKGFGMLPSNQSLNGLFQFLMSNSQATDLLIFFALLELQ